MTRGVSTLAHQPEPQSAGEPAGADEVFARTLHAWLDSRPRTNLRLQQAADAWLVATGL